MIHIGIAAIALVVIITMPTLASAPLIGTVYYFQDQSGQHWMQVSSLGDFSIHGTTGNVLLCSGVGARVTNGGLVVTIGSSSWLGSAGYVQCQAGIYKAARASGLIAGIVTVVLASPTSVGYPPIMVLSMTQGVPG